MIYAISDIHGYYEVFEKRIRQLKNALMENDDRLILLGDYIDRGPDSYKVLALAYLLQKQYGEDKVIVIRGNHDDWFLDFLEGGDDYWIAEDDNYNTSKTFLSEEQKVKLQEITLKEEAIAYIRTCVKKNHGELIAWMKKMPYYYETPTQIFVHAGVDEDIPEEELKWCTLGTPEYILTGKFPPTTGKFFKDIIAGHIDVASIANDENFEGIYFDKESHYYIDGCVERTGKLLCLVYDEQEKKYYELDKFGIRKKI